MAAGTQRYLYAEPVLAKAGKRGSIIAIADANGALQNINRYDEYGIPASTNQGRFGYTGQAWLSELGLNYYKARMYSPTLGRFMQTDPIGYGDGMNMYAYVGGDPVNRVDPTGLEDIVVEHPRCGGAVQGWSCGIDPMFEYILMFYGMYGTYGAPPAPYEWPSSGGGGGSAPISEPTPTPPAEEPQSGDAPLTPSEIDDIVVTAARARSIDGVRINFNLRYPQEQLWVLYGRDDFAYLGINGAARGNTGENRGTPPRPGYQAIIHTHPSWAEYGPGPKDFGFRVPLYGIAPGVWVVRPGATTPTRLYGGRP